MKVINLSVMEDKLNNLNPKQIISDVGKVNISLYYIKYSYTTVRNNRKTAEKYFLKKIIDPQLNVKDMLFKWVEKFNCENPHRAISNVKFLEGSCIGAILI